MPEESLDRGDELFVENELPVVNNLQEKRVLALLPRADVANAYFRLLYGQLRGAESAAAPDSKTR